MIESPPLERKRERARIWKRLNAEKDKAATKAWRERNKEHLRMKRREYYLAHKQLENERGRVYKSENRTRVTETFRNWRKANHARHMASQRRRTARWESKNPGSRSDRSSRRRARIRGATIDPKLVREFTNMIRSKRVVRCYYCGSKLPGKKAHIDHVKAVDHLGPHEIGNLCASCPRCNLTKSNKPLPEWKRTGQQILPL